jgi:outer membrane receptor for Fe3+-dicitrate
MAWNRAVLILAGTLVLSLSGIASGQTQPGAPSPSPQPQAGQTSEAKPDSGKTKAEEKTTVTGSHIRRKNPTTTSPTTVITKEQIDASGYVTNSGALKNIPGTPR